jgi:hypothetical protein
MADPSKKMCVSHEVLYKLLQRNECSDISESEYSSDSEINVKFSSCGFSSDEEENVSDSSNMQHGIWAKSDAEGPWHKC